MGTKKERTSNPAVKSQYSIPSPVSNQDESHASKLLKFAGTWEGDDFEQCLKEVYKTRGESKF